jgi:hypothetical protein
VTVRELAELVWSMRQAQREYDELRTPNALSLLRHAERQVDRAVERELGLPAGGQAEGGAK